MKKIGEVFYSDKRGFKKQIDINCVCCSKNQADHFHHLIPYCEGGRSIIPVCHTCHAKLHDRKEIAHSALIKKGIEKRRKAGLQVGRKKTRNSALIRELGKQKYSHREIAKLVGCSKTTVTRELALGAKYE